MPRKETEGKKPDPEVLTFTEAHEFLRVSYQTINKLMESGLPSHKVGKKRVFFKVDLVKWIKDH